MRHSCLVLVGTLLTIFSINSQAWGLMFSTVGNKPLGAANYKDWPGIVPVVNHESLVFHTWVNGNEHFYYNGNNESLNDALRKYAASGIEVHEVVLRPKIAPVQSVKSAKKIEFNWSLHIVGGISKVMSQKKYGDNYWSKHPVMTIYVGDDIQLEKIKIPVGIKVLELDDLEKRFAKGLESADKSVRGWGAGQLAQLDPYSKSNMEIVAKLLKDDDNWVRLNVAGALAKYGKKGKTVLPALREALNTDDKRLEKRIKETIEKIENAEDRTVAEKEHLKIRSEINQFKKGL